VSEQRVVYNQGRKQGGWG